MDKYIGIGFVILCLTILVYTIISSGYKLFLSKEKVDISPAFTNTNSIQI